MSEYSQTTTGRGGAPPSMLVVTTVAQTMGFLTPYVRHFRQRGWRVDGCASGITEDDRADVFDAVYELRLSRSIKDVQAMAGSVTVLRSALARGYDIVHVHTPIAAFMARALIRRMPVESRPQVVYTAHGFHFHEGGHPLTNFVFATAERVAGRWTDRLVVINAEDYQAAKHNKLVPTRRLRYMRGIGVDTDWYSPANVSPEARRRAQEEIGMNPDRPYFVTVGELSRRKRPSDVVQALAQMRDRAPALLLLGDGPERIKVEETAAAAGVAQRVIMPGNVTDVRQLISGAIALVQASSREGLPRSIMEALSLEVPVIATTARGQEELVGSDRGYVVPIGAIAEMANAMDQLARDPDERAAMGERGRRLMIERYDLDSLIEEHERLYAELLADEPASVPSESPDRD